MNAAATTPVSFVLPSRVYDAIARRAAEMGKRPAEYIRLLLDAAWLSRVAGERGEESYDAKLDRAVRQTFLLADAEPEFIAQAIGAPQSWVERILEGWRRAAADPSVLSRAKASEDNGATGEATMRRADGMAGEASRPVSGRTETATSDDGRDSRERPAPPPAPKEKTDPRTLKAWPPETVETARRMWAEGASASEIGKAVDKTGGAVTAWMMKNRHICPKRRVE